MLWLIKLESKLIRIDQPEPLGWRLIAIRMLWAVDIFMWKARNYDIFSWTARSCTKFYWKLRGEVAYKRHVTKKIIDKTPELSQMQSTLPCSGLMHDEEATWQQPDAF